MTNTVAASGTTGRVPRRRVLIVDDHPIVLGGLRRLLDQEPDLIVCGEACSASEAMQQIEERRPDLVLLDISLNGTSGIELTRTIRQSFPPVPVLILSMHDESLYAERALRAGANGYIMKQETPGTLLGAIRQVLAGGSFLSSSMSSQLVADLVNNPTRRPPRPGVAQLSDRELEILDYIGRAYTTRAIADRLNLSVKTIEAHKSNIKRKLNLRTGAELTRYAVQWVEGQKL